MFRLLHILLFSALFWALATVSAYSTTFNYSNTGSTPIPDGPSANTCGTPITRTISVSDSFTISDVNVGVIITHPYKEDLLVNLSSPSGTNVDVIDSEGSDFANFNILLDDEASASIENRNHVVTNPYPEYTRLPTNPLSAFDGENAQGTWTLTVSDCWVNDTGTLQDFYLELRDDVFGPVQGTSGNDTMALGFTDADGDQVTAGPDIIEGLDGNDKFVAEDTEAVGDTLRGGSGTDIFQNGYSGPTNNTDNDIHISAATLFDSVEIIDGNDGNTTNIDLRLDGTGTFDLSSVTDFRQINDILSNATSGDITVLLPNLDENLPGTFFLDDGANVTLTYGTNLPDRRVNVELGNGNDIVTGGRGNDNITLGGGSDTIILYDGFNDGAGSDNIYGFTAGGDDQLDVTALTDTSGGSVSADEVTPLSFSGGADTLLVFPNGERLRLYGVAFADMDEESELQAAGIGAPATDPLIVTSTADTNTIGTLRYAINHANANPADDNITFDLPLSDSGFGGSRGVFVITLTSQLPNITDDGVTINGASQASNVGNTNLGNIVNATTVGVNNTAIAAVPAPEIEIVGNDTIASALFIESANNVTLSDLALLGTETGIRVSDNSTGILLERLVIGARADDISDPGASLRHDTGLGLDNNNNNVTIQNSVISNIDSTRGIAVGDSGLGSGNSLTVDGVHFINNGLGQTLQNGAIEIIQNTSPTLLVRGSRFVAPAISTDIGVELNPFNTLGMTCVSCIIEDNSFDGLSNAIGVFGPTTSNLIIRRNIIENSGESAVLLGALINSSIIQNDIFNSGNAGIEIFDSSARVAITENTIFSNIGLGIDLEADGPSLNDASDVDTGANDLLNFPVFNSVNADGTNTIDYDFNLDAPNSTDGYRIEFFKNSVPHSTSYGEGEIYLGFIDITHNGGDLNFTGSLTTTSTINIGDNISATTTRKTASSFDITSEFSLNATTISSNPASLIVAKTVAPLNAGDYALPGSDVVYTFAVTNEGDGAVDTDSIVLIDSLPPEIIFYNGDHDGPGPSTDVVGFEESSTSLTFDPNADALFSNGTSRPADLSECNYTPSAGYDPNVKYVCFNPKGAMLGGEPTPNFNIRFRARIQ